jgi:hypothetical protein
MIPLALILAAAATHQVSLPDLVRADLPAVHRKSGVPVLLPSKAPASGDVTTIHGTGFGRRTHYAFTFFYGDTCGANACNLGSVTGRKGGRPAFTATVTLRGGRTGYYKPLTCGGSCSPPEIEWVQRGVLYSIQWGDVTRSGARKAMIGLANSAIAAGAR